MTLTVPPRAWLLYLPFGIGGLLLGMVIGVWTVPLVCAVVHDGIVGIGAIPIRDVFFADPPEWVRGTLRDLLVLAQVTTALAGAGTLGVLGSRLWRFLVVRKLHWMTDKEVDEFFRRDPGI